MLSLGGLIVKQFTEPALNQETVLTAFEESGWPEQIDDPIPPHGEPTPKARLRSTIWHLNRRQKNKLLKFHGDGTGEGVRWERTSQNGFGAT